MTNTELPPQEMQVVISFELPRDEDRGKEMAMQGEVATRVYKVVEHLKDEFTKADIPAKIFSQVVTTRKPRTRRTKAQIQQDADKTNGNPDEAQTESLGIPQFLKRPAAEEAKVN